MKKNILTIAFTILLCCNSFAQKKSQWSINIGGSFPIGDFAKMEYDKNTLGTDCALFDDKTFCGAASSGLSLGSTVLFPLQFERLSFAVSLDLHYNPLNSNAKSYLTQVSYMIDAGCRQEIANGGGSSITSSCSLDWSGAYYNIPILVGLRYTLPFQNGMSAFAEGNIGYNLRILSPIRFTERISCLYRGQYISFKMKETLSYATKGTVTFRMGVGICFTEKLSLSAFYYYLGKGEVFSTSTVDDGESQPSKQSFQLGTLTPMVITLKIGYNI
ncbi:MAG: hypothetical protein IJ785_04730 [Bacteroidales bacterium]|nr:hypothetical protein [Bacteroidales bacterium]